MAIQNIKFLVNLELIMKLMFSKMIHHILSLKISRWGLIQYTMCLLSSLGRIDFGTKIMTLVECLHQIFQITSKNKLWARWELFRKKIYLMKEKKKLYEICWLFIRCNSSCPIPSTFSFFFLLFYLFIFDNERLLSNFKTKTIFVSHFCNFNESLWN